MGLTDIGFEIGQRICVERCAPLWDIEGVLTRIVDVGILLTDASCFIGAFKTAAETQFIPWSAIASIVSVEQEGAGDGE